MFCTNCGTKVNDENKFCPNCGKQLENQTAQTVNSTKNSTNEIYKVDPEESKKKIIGNNIDYYLKQFNDLKYGSNGKINWVSFFFSLLHACYRNVWKEWLKELWKPLVLQFVCAFLGSLLFFKQPTVAIFLFFAVFIGFIWQIVGQILFAKNFNNIYMSHVEQKLAQKDITPDPSPVRVVICWAIYVVFMIICGVISTALFFNLNAVNANFYDDYHSQYEYHNDAQEEVYQQETAYLEDYWSEAIYVDLTATVNTSYASGIILKDGPDNGCADINMPIIPNGTDVQIYYQIEIMTDYYWFYVQYGGYGGWIDMYSLDLHAQ